MSNRINLDHAEFLSSVNPLLPQAAIKLAVSHILNWAMEAGFSKSAMLADWSNSHERKRLLIFDELIEFQRDNLDYRFLQIKEDGSCEVLFVQDALFDLLLRFVEMIATALFAGFDNADGVRLESAGKTEITGVKRANCIPGWRREGLVDLSFASGLRR